MIIHTTQSTVDAVGDEMAFKSSGTRVLQGGNLISTYVAEIGDYEAAITAIAAKAAAATSTRVKHRKRTPRSTPRSSSERKRVSSKGIVNIRMPSNRNTSFPTNNSDDEDSVTDSPDQRKMLQANINLDRYKRRSKIAEEAKEAALRDLTQLRSEHDRCLQKCGAAEQVTKFAPIVAYVCVCVFAQQCKH